MEERILDRQVTKTITSKQIIDSEQVTIDLTTNDLEQLYSISNIESDLSCTTFPNDVLLVKIGTEYPSLIRKYKDYDSLFTPDVSTGLSKEEKASTWKSFQKLVERESASGGKIPKWYHRTTSFGLKVESPSKNHESHSNAKRRNSIPISKGQSISTPEVLFRVPDKILTLPKLEEPAKIPNIMYGGFRGDLFLDVFAEKAKKMHPSKSEDDIYNELIPQVLSAFYKSMDEGDDTVSI